MLFGEYVKKLRSEKKWTLQELSKRCNVNIALLSDYENGRRPPPGPQTIYKLAKVFNVPYVELHKLAIQQEIPNFDIKYYDKKFFKSAFFSDIDPSKLPEQGCRELKTYFDFLLRKYSDVAKEQKISHDKTVSYGKKKNKKF